MLDFGQSAGAYGSDKLHMDNRDINHVILDCVAVTANAAGTENCAVVFGKRRT